MFSTFVDRIIVTFLLLWSSSQACNPNEVCLVDLENKNIKNLVASMDYFTTQLIQKLYDPQDPSTSPRIVSPISIYTTLAFLLFGSAGDTQKELIQVLRFPDADLQGLKKNFGDILIATAIKTSETTDGKEDIMAEGHVAEGIFIQKGLTLVQEYADYLSALNIIAHPVDFSSSDAMSAIYRWMDENTPGGSGSKSFSSGGSTRIFFNSLFYLTTKWMHNIFLDKDVGLVPFHTLDNRVIDVQMMKASAAMYHYDNGGSFTALVITSEWLEYTMTFVLPNDGVDPVQVVTSFTVEMLRDILLKAELKDVDCQIPKMSYSLTFEINSLLGKLGISKLFDEEDLSQMLDGSNELLGIQISHNVHIIIDEKGITAEGLIVEKVDKDSPSENLTPFIADRPFLMLIHCTTSYAIAFANFFYTTTSFVSASSP